MGTSNEEKRITKEYLLDIITQYKLTKKQIQTCEEEKSVWIKRIELARSQGRSDLAGAAEEKRENCDNSLISLKNHLNELAAEMRRARSELKILDSEPDLSIDPEALLENLETMGGKIDPIADEFKETEADSALDSLKKEMGLKE